MKTSIVALFLGVAAARLADYNQVQVRFLDEREYGLSEKENNQMIYKVAPAERIVKALSFSQMIDKINSPESLALNQGVPVLVEPTL